GRVRYDWRYTGRQARRKDRRTRSTAFATRAWRDCRNCTGKEIAVFTGQELCHQGRQEFRSFQFFLGRLAGRDGLDRDCREPISAAHSSEVFAVGDQSFAGGNGYAVFGPIDLVLAAIGNVHGKRLLEANDAGLRDMKIRIVFCDDGVRSDGRLQFVDVTNAAGNDRKWENGAL